MTTFSYVDRITANYRVGINSGFGVKNNEDIINPSIRVLFNKWRNLWSSEQLENILKLAREYYRLQSICKESNKFKELLVDQKTRVNLLENKFQECNKQLLESNCRFQESIKQIAERDQKVVELEKLLNEKQQALLQKQQDN